MSPPNFVSPSSPNIVLSHISLIFVQFTLISLSKAPAPISLYSKLSYPYIKIVFKEFSIESLREAGFLHFRYGLYLHIYFFT